MADTDHTELQDELGRMFQERSGTFLAPDDDDDEAELPSTGLLVGWCLVCEWAGDDGKRWLSYHRNNGQPTWATRGLLGEALADLP